MTMPGSVRVGSLLGIPLYINVSWLAIFALLTVSLIGGQFPGLYPYWDAPTYVVLGLATSGLFFASVVAHELAHCVVALRLGIPVRGITLFIFGGVAHIGRDAAHPAGELLMAAAGPVASVALSAAFAAVWVLARNLSDPVAAGAAWLGWVNLSLGIFNLMPGFPLDGGRMLRALLWWAGGDFAKATIVAGWIGRGLALMLVVLGIALTIGRPSQVANGAWIAFIGWFISQAATAAMRQARLRRGLDGYLARDLMVGDVPWVPARLSVRDLVERFVGRTGRRWFLVAEDGALQGLVTMSDVRRVPKQRWGATEVAAIMTAASRLTNVEPHCAAPDVLDAMQEHGYQQVPVVEDGRLVGVVTAARLFETARAPRALGF